MGEVLCGVTVLLLVGAVVGYCNPVAERYRDKRKRERHARLIGEGWCFHYARAVVFGEPPPLTKYACCKAMADGESAGGEGQ